MERGDYFSSSGLLYHFWIWHVARNLSFLATFWKHLAITAHQGVWVSDWRYYFSPLHWAIPCLFVQDLICIASPNLVKRKISLCQQIVICTYKRFPSHIAFQNVNLSVWKKFLIDFMQWMVLLENLNFLSKCEGNSSCQGNFILVSHLNTFLRRFDEILLLNYVGLSFSRTLC